MNEWRWEKKLWAHVRDARSNARAMFIFTRSRWKDGKIAGHTVAAAHDCSAHDTVDAERS